MGVRSQAGDPAAVAAIGTSPLPEEPDEAAAEEWMQRACRRVWAADADGR